MCADFIFSLLISNILIANALLINISSTFPDIVLDNAGYELFTDLILADYLISSKLVNKIRFHAKSQPWFVSDVNPSDFEFVLNAVTNDLEDSTLNDLGKKWRSFLNSGTFQHLIEVM